MRAKNARRTGYHRVIDYPRQNLRGIRHWLPSWRLLLGLCLAYLLGTLALIV